MNYNTKLLAEQNDMFRKHIGMVEMDIIDVKGKLNMTMGVDALSNFQKLDTLIKLWAYDDFNEDNDPHGEHDFGRFTLDENKQDILWKIDYYDTNYEYGSEDPSNLKITRRVLTVMLPSEY
ncbi:DUF3768 domain-containing protein [Winogradskyella sp. SYSU M77433]|uniref:DUF3768 domain-containing protein n=1 Tax=Winogradskyella sp. SYSU M77433 TaxID=3042722 RepID=UPI0024813890|nr:DUF3768 domain-containing protein [Winogradskyella sp. SYSU M77433]MDH7913462.1 DUF3768 domain-containing protein [Winogradskyella sp. SYSU M77433]